MPPNKIYIHYLGQLRHLLLKIEQHNPAILSERLCEDMFPLLQQARTAVGFTLRSCCPLAGREIVSFANGDYTLTNLLSEIDQATEYLAELSLEDFADAEAVSVSTVAGFAELTLPGDEYFLMYSLPNFFFHYNMVYAIARKCGLAVGKADYDGYHQYPEGFQFS